MADDEEKDKDPSDEEPKKKNKMLLFIIIGLSVLLIGAGGFFAYKKFTKPPPKPISAEELKKQQEKKIGEMFELDPFVVNLSDPRGKRYLKLKITLELDPETTSETITPYTPKIRDMVIMLLTSLTFDEVMTPEGKIRLRDELFERFNLILKPHRIKNMYFTNFVVQ